MKAQTLWLKDLTDQDRVLLDIQYEDHDIEAASKEAWKKFVKTKVKIAAFAELIQENSTK